MEINPGDCKGRFISKDVKNRYISFDPIRWVPAAIIRRRKRQPMALMKNEYYHVKKFSHRL
jgi:hypothetical protein